MFKPVKIISLPIFVTAVAFILQLAYVPCAEASTRIKDITKIQNEYEVDLIGYGLVIGLDGTGDGKGSPFTAQSIANMMERMGVTIAASQLKIKNVAAVMVTSRIKSTDRIGSKIDVTVSSIGDAGSLQGGNLLLTPLASGNGDVYATAQGPVSIGGFNVQVDQGNKIINNYTLVGRVPTGGTITRALDVQGESKDVILTLTSPDYTTASRIAQTINKKYGFVANIENISTIRVEVPDSLSYFNERTHFISDIGKMRINPDQIAKVVINERTGTIVAGQHVSIAPVAIAHGNITVNIKSYPSVSQPEPFSQGETVVTNEYQISVDQSPTRVMHTDEIVNLADIAEALNLLGAAPRDIIAIFQALKEAGALRAELVII